MSRGPRGASKASCWEQDDRPGIVRFKERVVSRVGGDEVLALVALLRHSKTDSTVRGLVDEIRELGALEVLHRQHPQTLLDMDPTAGLMEAARRDLEAWHEVAQVLTLFDSEFPAQLREVHDLPPLLFARGKLSDDRGACIVGSRLASPEALRFAKNVATRLAELHIPVISGLADGIDTAAHTATLAAGGRTVAVIGTGIDQFFPKGNEPLQQQIAREGLVLSQFWPGSGPTKATFPMRNATMSAYGMCTLIVTAGEKSGARIQARQAVAHGRPLLLTRDVVTRTEWGREWAASAYDVKVVDTAEDAVDAIRQILNRPQLIDDLLVELSQ
jgi:DNA processing protein